MIGATRKYFATAVLALVFLGVGTLIGGFVQTIRGPDERCFDLSRAAMGVDFEYRLLMLRLLRQYKVPKATVNSIEIGAVVLLDTMDVEHVSPTDQSFTVMQKLVKDLRQYRKDFPGSEFDLERHPFVGRVLAKFPENQASH
jgi:hypothetical protein